MAVSTNDLGKLVTVHGLAPAYMQRAVFIAVLSFMFFMAGMFAFYIRQSILFFILATGFLVLYAITMFSLMTAKKRNVEIFENGLKFKKINILWSEVVSVSDIGEVVVSDGSIIVLPPSSKDLKNLVAYIRDRSAL